MTRWWSRSEVFLSAAKCRSSMSICRCRTDAVECTLHRAEKFGVIYWLEEKRESACSHDHGFGGEVFVAGDENHPGLRRSRAKVGQQFHPRHCFHPDVQDGDGHKMVGNVIEKGFWLAKGGRLETSRLEQSTERLAHGRVIVNQANDRQIGLGHAAL